MQDELTAAMCKLCALRRTIKGLREDWKEEVRSQDLFKRWIDQLEREEAELVAEWYGRLKDRGAIVYQGFSFTPWSYHGKVGISIVYRETL